MKPVDRALPAPPYGPTRGTIQALQLLQRQSPARVDQAFLRSQGIAPRNEYKVVGALRFLGLLDAEGRPTERAHLLKARGPTFTLNLQEVVREAYGELFRQVPAREASQEEVYNYFVVKAHLGGEMAVKATRFFRSLCQWAGIPLPEEPPKTSRPRLVGVSSRPKAPGRGRRGPGESTLALGGEGLPLVLAITPEMAQMGEEELAQLFRKIRRAAQQSVS